MKQLVTTLLFLRQDDEILLAMKKRGHGAGRWNGVGGKLETGETPEQAVTRECQEEIGVTPKVFAKVAEHEFHQAYNGESARNLVHTYLCTDWDGEPTESDEMAPCWFALSDIPYADMWPDDKHWLPRILAGDKLRTTFRYDTSDILQSYEITALEVPA